MEDNEDPVQEKAIRYSEGIIVIERSDCGYICINPEILPGGLPSDRFHVFYVNMEYGSSTFYISMADDAGWEGEGLPRFVKQDLVDMIGDRIERREA